MYRIKIAGKGEGIRADYVEKVIDYWRAVFRELKGEEGYVFYVIRAIEKGSIVFDVDMVRKRRKKYVPFDIPEERLEEINNVEEVFYLEDPGGIARAFRDEEFGIKEMEIRKNGWRIKITAEDIERYQRRIHREYGTIVGQVLAISAINVKEGVRVGLRWALNPGRTIRVKVGPKYEGVVVQNYKGTVEVMGLIYYGLDGKPVKIEDVRYIKPIKKTKPNIDEVSGILEEPIDSVEFLRQIRSEWNDEEAA